MKKQISASISWSYEREKLNYCCLAWWHDPQTAGWSFCLAARSHSLASVEDESGTDGKSSFKSIIYQPLPEQKSLDGLQDSSALVSWSGSPVVLFGSHFARHRHHPPALLHMPWRTGMNLNQPPLNIHASTDTHFPLRCLHNNGRKPNLYAAKPPLSGFVCHRVLQ